MLGLHLSSDAACWVTKPFALASLGPVPFCERGDRVTVRPGEHLMVPSDTGLVNSRAL